MKLLLWLHLCLDLGGLRGLIWNLVLLLEPHLNLVMRLTLDLRLNLRLREDLGLSLWLSLNLWLLVLELSPRLEFGLG